VIWFSQIYMVMPSGYCGATSVMLQMGKRKISKSTNAPQIINILPRFFIVQRSGLK